VRGHADAGQREPGQPSLTRPEAFGFGALAELRDVTMGSRVLLTDTFGDRHTYRVTARRTYPKYALPRSVFSGAPLVLITCGGPFDQEHGHYRDNIVVYATAVTT
jgi:hypothetical protein